MSLPTLPMTYFIVVQAGLAFDLFNAPLYGTALCSDLSHLEQGHICRRVGKLVSDLFRVVERTTSNQPGISSRQGVVPQAPALSPGHRADDLGLSLPLGVRAACLTRRSTVQLAEASTSTGPLHDSERPQPVAAEGSQPVLDRPRLLIATSGSGGSPKLVGLSDANLLASVRAANQRLRLSKTSVWLDCLPLVHIGGLSIPLRCVLAGACVVLQEGFHAPGVLDQLHRHKVSHVSLVPAMLARLLELDGRPPRDLRVVLVGGAPLSASLAGEALAAGWPLWVTYGMTETASMLTARKLAAPDDNPQQVGRPLPGFELRLVDEQGEPTSAAGVIQVSGAAVCDGGDPSAERWFSTGDRGQMDEAGRLTLLGRADSMLISGGEKVYPELVEEQLAGFPGIDEVAVSGRADPVWGERLVAVYRGDIDEAALAQLCRDGIAGAMRPRAFVKVDNLPRTANGKLDRGALRDLVAQL